MGIEAVVNSFENVQHINHNPLFKLVTIHSPHWKSGASGYRKFIRGMLETCNTTPGYMYMIDGNCSFKGAIILQAIQRHLKRCESVEHCSLKFTNCHGNYQLIVRIKGN